MNTELCLALALVLGAAVGAWAQAVQDAPSTPPAALASVSHVDLEWTPPALDALRALAPIKSSFTLDRDMLAGASALLPDSEAQTRETLRKLDGIGVHLMRFGDGKPPDEAAVEAVRQAYHQRGWKHLVTTTNSGGPVHNGTTDVWIVLDGATVRGAVILAETPKTVALVTVAGNLNPIDLLHLRGHFGIPRFEGDGLREPKH